MTEVRGQRRTVAAVVALTGNGAPHDASDEPHSRHVHLGFCAVANERAVWDPPHPGRPVPGSREVPGGEAQGFRDKSDCVGVGCTPVCSWRRRCVPVEVVEQAVKGVAGPVEVSVGEPRSPVGFELGNPDTCRIQERPPAACGVDELRTPVGGIRPTLEVVQIAEFVDEFGARREAQRGLSR